MQSGVAVLHVPGGHGYVEHLHDDRVPGARAVSAELDAGPGWRPSPALDAAWVSSHAHRFDVLHVHFGFEGRTPQQLRELVGALRARGRALVLTVHDLQNPHLHEQRGYEELLDVLVPAAAGLVTLTPGAADEVERRWARRPVVVPHPHVAALEEIGHPRSARSSRVVGVHLKSLRANVDALPVLRALTSAVARLPGTRLRVDVHDEVLDPTFPRHDADLVRWLRGVSSTGGIDLRAHERYDDDELVEYLRELDVSVLPYRHGTHSGWLELCHDLGVPVVAGRVGYLHQQQALVQVDLHDERTLVPGLQRALAGPPGSTADAERRLAQRLEIARAHRELYLRVLAGTGRGPARTGVRA